MTLQSDKDQVFARAKPELNQSMNILSGISSRPLSVEAMIATCFTADHDSLVRDLGYIVEVVFKGVCRRTLGMSGQMSLRKVVVV